MGRTILGGIKMEETKKEKEVMIDEPLPIYLNREMELMRETIVTLEMMCFRIKNILEMHDKFK